MLANLADVSLEYLADDGAIPNSALPVIVYRRAISDPSPEAFEALFDTNGWPSAWRYGVYDFHHYHSTTHECLGIARGSAHLLLGGANGKTVAIEAGDVVVLPAGTGHCNVGASDDFLVVGAYPPGFSADLLRGERGERPAADDRIAGVPLPKSDPVGRQAGPVMKSWRKG